MKNSWIVGLPVLALTLGAQGELSNGGAITGATRELVGGQIYTVRGTVGISAGQNADGLTIKPGVGADGHRVVINIPADSSLTVSGGDTDSMSQTGAGAGIRLPEDMTLYVTGKGRLEVAGGKAANGRNGIPGYFAYRTGTQHTNGRGGEGGSGGGGAGAGIGGSGGKGSGFSVGGTTETRTSKHGSGFPADGKKGSTATDGTDGKPCGTVYILGDLSVNVRGGAAGQCGQFGGIYGLKTEEKMTDHWWAGGGGPGGAGGGGGGAQSIGGGGGGGGSGGSGGNGSFVVHDNGDIDDAVIRGGRGGNGGCGVFAPADTQTKGEEGGTTHNYEEKDKASSKAGNGADGGQGYQLGTSGKFYALPTTGLTLSPYRACDPIVINKLETFHKVKMTLDLGLKDKSGAPVKLTYEQPFACPMDELVEPGAGGVNPRVKRAGYRFAGYWAEDGTCVYGPDYKATLVLSPYVDDLTLHARWEVDSSILAVTSSGDGESTLDVYENAAITLRDAVKALVDDPLLVGSNGCRRVVFDLAETDTVVRLSREITVPANVRSFEINGLYGLTNGVRLVAGPQARHFTFLGQTEDLGGAFSLVSLTFEGGNPSNGDGGAIYTSNGTSLSVASCSFLGNRTKENARDGGAIYQFGKASKLLVSSSTFAGNSAYKGGAVVLSEGEGIFVNTTFSCNAALTLGGGGLQVNEDAQFGLLSCTFAGNTAGKRSLGQSLNSENPMASSGQVVNCIFAAGEKDTHSIVIMSQKQPDWSSVDVDPAVAFASSGAAVTQVVVGVTHVIYPPLGGARAGNENAAEIYHDASYKHLLAVGRDGNELVLSGERDLAKIPFILDQTQAVRTAPTRGAVRLAVGTEPVSVELDGVLLDDAGRPRENATVETKATVFYDGGETTEADLVLKTAECGVFGLSVPVDGSDGLAHNVTGVKVDALGDAEVTVTTAPYALTAASVDVIGTNEYLPLTGEAIAIGNVIAQSLSVTNSFDARGADSFTAGSLKGFGEIDLQHVTLAGGRLDWLGGARPTTNKTGVAFANLAEKTVDGGVTDDTMAYTLTTGTYGMTSRDWVAAHDGFFQLQALCRDPKGGEVALNLFDEKGDRVVEVTPQGTVLPTGTGTRRLLWTVPVRKGMRVRLTISGKVISIFGIKVYGDFSLSSVKGQFIYFGVAE